MLLWHRKIWLGDGDKPGQSVYWDTKEKKAYFGESSKLVSANKSRNNGLYAGIGVVAIIVITVFFKLNGITVSVASVGKNESFWLAVLTLIFSMISIYFMNRFFYRRHTKYTETTLKRAKMAIKTHPFSGPGWKELFILEPFMFIAFGGFAIAIVYGAIKELVVDLK